LHKVPRILAVLFLILALSLPAAAPAPAADVVNRIVAVVNGEIITLFDLNQHLKPLLEQFKQRELTDTDRKVLRKFQGDVLQKPAHLVDLPGGSGE